MPTLSKSQAIVLVADSFEYTGEELNVTDRMLDRPQKWYVDELLKAFKQYHSNVIWYASPQDFLSNIENHYDDVVFPYWYGENSRNRHSLIPAICEATNIRYVGGDAYTKIVCNDKHLSKELCAQSGLATPSSALIGSEADLETCPNLQYPCIVKPLFEGTSLGISHDNLVADPENAARLTRKLLTEFNQPVLIEEHIVGREVSVALIGWGDTIRHWEAGERYIEGNEEFFLNNLYTYVEKKSSTLPLALRSVRDEISDTVLESCRKVFSLLDKVEYMRIDGRLTADDFVVIELTPETHMGERAEFCGTIGALGLSYSEILGTLIENCLERYQNQSAS